MTQIKENVRVWLERFLDQYEVAEDGVVLVHDNGQMDPILVKSLYDALSLELQMGTIGVFGDHNLNEHVGLSEDLKNLTTQERMVLGSGVLLQLLTLNQESSFAYHPSHLIGFKGKYAPYLSRNFELDFPYGPVSIYNDLYGMDALVIHLGPITAIPEARYAFSKRKDAIIQKNTAIQQGQLISFLDYDVDEEVLTQAIYDTGLVHTHDCFGVEVHVYRYQDLIDALKLTEIN